MAKCYEGFSKMIPPLPMPPHVLMDFMVLPPRHGRTSEVGTPVRRSYVVLMM